jgi:hypothetical protein
LGKFLGILRKKNYLEFFFHSSETTKLLEKQNQFADHSVLLYKFNKTSAASLDATYNDKWFYIIIFLIFGLSLLQALLSIIGMTLSFVWSPCCQTTYTPLRVIYLYFFQTKSFILFYFILKESPSN